MTGKNWRIGVAGLGTVGGGLLNFLSDRPGFAPAGGQAVVTGVSARSRSRPRPFDISNLPWFDDPVALAASPDNDLFVELIGGSDGPAKAAVEAALSAGKPVVTANKALIAEHGAELALLAESKGVPLLFEAAVMGGTPAVKMLREAMVGDDIKSVAGILNGTCNYILTEMDSGGRAFADVLAEAQRLGYAESDPTMDVGGFDAAHKISILAALAFGCAPTYAAAEIEGVAGIELLDIKLARDLGYRVKLVASADRSSDGVLVRVHPSLAPINHPLAQAGGALHRRDPDRHHLYPGPGRGRGPHRRRRGRRHRRRDDRGGSAGLPTARRGVEAFHPGGPLQEHGAGLSAVPGEGRAGRHRGGLRDLGGGRGLHRELPAEAGGERRWRTHRAHNPRRRRIRSDGGDRPHRESTLCAGETAPLAHRAHLRISR